ncbi:DUF11 domain-containing protein [Streptomyces sp. NPDC050803]|uniref:DUF11 domain-containing protein n=1 Tax=unclassified Streptomyces TaxID=2593676 RepID=UPI003448EC16
MRSGRDERTYGTPRRRPRWIALLASGVMAGSALVAAAPSPAAAAAAPAVTGPVSITTNQLTRANGTWSGLFIRVPTTENARIDLTLALPSSVADTFVMGCETFNGATPDCDAAGGGDTIQVAVSEDGDGVEEATTVQVIVRLYANTDTDLSSVEGDAMVHRIDTVAVTAAPGTGTSGQTSTDSGPMEVLPGPGDALIELTTTAPEGTPSVPQGGSVRYEATLERFGRTDQTTEATVGLVADAAQGTTVPQPTQTVAFAPGETDKQVAFTVNVPASAPLAAATYHLVATYDPNGTDGSPTDTETGAQRSFRIVAPPRADLRTTLTAPATVRTHRQMTYTVTVHNDGPDPAADTVATLNLPPRVIPPGDGDQVVWNLGTIAAGASRTVEVTVQVRVAPHRTVTAHASAVSATADPDTSDNTATATTQVVPR